MTIYNYEFSWNAGKIVILASDSNEADLLFKAQFPDVRTYAIKKLSFAYESLSTPTPYEIHIENENLHADLHEAREAMDNMREELTEEHENGKRLDDIVKTLLWIIEEGIRNGR